MTNFAVAMICAVASAAVLLLPAFAKVRWPVLIFIAAYTVTTVIGAAALLDPWGYEQFKVFLPYAGPFDHGMLGSATYWFFLLLPFGLIPPAALAGQKAAELLRLNRWQDVMPRMDVSTLALYLLLAGFAAYCLYKLYQVDGLFPSTFDRDFCYGDRIERRMELMPLLGGKFYAYAYSSIPIISVMFLTKYLITKQRACLAGFAISLVLAAWLYLAIYMKAPAVILAGFIGMAFIFSGIGIIRSVVVAAVVGATILTGLTLLQFCTSETGPRVSARDLSTLPSGMTSLVVFRMATGFPYYIDTFSEPKERCGIDMPYLPFVPETTCFPPTKVYQLVHPYMEGRQGYQPAPVHVYGLAEGGPYYAVLVTLLGGCIIGVLCSMAGTGRSPIAVGTKVAVCVYAYYLSQVHFTSALIHSYGLLWLLVPLGMVVVLNFCLLRPPGVASAAPR